MDADNKTMFVYDGGLSEAPPDWNEVETLPDNTLWQFTPSGASGHWAQSYVSPSSIFSSLSRVSSAIYAYGNGLGFALGGIQSLATGDTGFTEAYDTNLVPGMVIYDISNKEWYNVSAKDYTYSGFTLNGAGQFVPSFGPNGLFFVLGGTTGTSDNPQFAQFDYAWMYEPYSKKWLSQQTSGDIPTETTNQCVVGVQGDEGTYEVCMQGPARRMRLTSGRRFSCTADRSMAMLRKRSITA